MMKNWFVESDMMRKRRIKQHFLWALIAGFMTCTGGENGWAQTQERHKLPPETEILRQINVGFTHIFKTVAPSVVIVKTEKVVSSSSGNGIFDSLPFNIPGLPKNFSPPSDSEKDEGSVAPQIHPDLPFLRPENAPIQGEGSGIIYDNAGHIITNLHVIEGADKITVRLMDKREFPAKVVGVDDKTDMAILKISASDVLPAQFGNSDQVQVGELVCAIGTPYFLDYTFTIGVISATGRSDLTALDYEEYLQTDASINPGNSGGPLVNVNGEVIGMNTMVNGINRGLGFAIPSNMVKEITNSLIQHGKIIRPWLGVRIEDLENQTDLQQYFKGIDSGVIIRMIIRGTPASESELRPADIITAVDGVKVSNARELQKLILQKKVGQKIVLNVWRDGKTQEISLKTGELPAEPSNLEPEETPMKPEVTPSTELGLQLQELTPELAERLELAEKEGVIVTHVEQGSPAAVAGILPQDVISEVNKQKISTPDDFFKIISNENSKQDVLLYISRQNEKTYAVLKISK